MEELHADLLSVSSGKGEKLKIKLVYGKCCWQGHIYNI